MTAPRVLVAPDSFKGTMSATTVANAICAGVRDAGDPVPCPFADGGEGTMEILRSALGGQLDAAPARSPLGHLFDANFLLLPDGQTAVVETATASGLTLLGSPGPREAWQSSSAGTGDLIAAAVDAGATRILLGVGGSACTDGGAGALTAITERGGLRGSHLVDPCDVQTTFDESATVYGSQKGADEATTRRLTARLNRLAETFPRDPRGRAATGASGGLSGGLWAALAATLIPGIDEILDLLEFDRLLGSVDAVITGEGRLDSQTLHGKVIDGVTRRAAAPSVPTWAIVGQSRATTDELATLRLSGVTAATNPAEVRRAAKDITSRLHAAPAVPVALSRSERTPMDSVNYTYIVVGAGAAGCVLANRLSADPSRTVLLLEAGGGDRSPFMQIPAGFSKLMGTRANWIFDTEPQRHLNNRRMFLPQGRALGGSTSINAMLYVRGNRSDYDEWRDHGNKGWGYDDVLPYFIKHENNERLADKYHGVGGELNVADQIQHNPTSAGFLRAAQEVGIPYTSDPNGAQQEGVFYHQVTQRAARRESASTAFLRPVQKRTNLTVITHAEALRIVVEGGRATGLTYRHKGQTVTARADAEVIVSAGAINSPRLLLQSGIGPADELRGVGIDVVHDLPGVGKNLHDQLEVYITREAARPVTYSGEDRWDRAARHALQYALYRTGPATATITEVGAFINSTPEVRSPDIQLHFLPAWVVWKDLARSADHVPGHGVTLLACNIRPKSRGSVWLKSSDPSVAPAVDPNYMEDPDDWKVAIESFHRMREVLAAKAFEGILKDEKLPGGTVRTDGEVRDYITQWAKTDYHPVGTCKMGIDPLAVVDPELCVHGLSGLRVVDSSIMPSIISGNTQAPSMMIGEKGADLILR